MRTRTHAAKPWLSWHLTMNRPYDPFLVDQLLPWLTEEVEADRLRRFFFIRYDEGGEHLRLRFRPGAAGDGLVGRLEARVRQYLEASGGEFRLQAVPYRRSEHYFGEKSASVYAELLNESTSWLALRLLSSLGTAHRFQRWLVLAATLDALHRRADDEEVELAAALTDSCEFPLRVAQAMGQPPADPAGRPGERWASAVAAVRPRVAKALDGDVAAGKTVALMRRCRKFPDDGPFVAVHALHLLCNKLGFSLGEEYEAFTTLHYLATVAGPFGTGGLEPGRRSVAVDPRRSI